MQCQQSLYELEAVCRPPHMNMAIRQQLEEHEQTLLAHLKLQPLAPVAVVLRDGGDAQLLAEVITGGLHEFSGAPDTRVVDLEADVILGIYVGCEPSLVVEGVNGERSSSRHG